MTELEERPENDVSRASGLRAWIGQTIYSALSKFTGASIDDLIERLEKADPREDDKVSRLNEQMEAAFEDPTHLVARADRVIEGLLSMRGEPAQCFPFLVKNTFGNVYSPQAVDMAVAVVVMQKLAKKCSEAGVR